MNALVLSVALATGPALAAGEAPPSSSGGESMWLVLGQFDAFPGAEPYGIADELIAEGVHFHSAGFLTETPPEQVIAFYRKSLERAGLFVVEAPANQHAFHGLSALDPKTGLQRTVVATGGEGRATEVVLSLADGAELDARQPPTDPGEGLPVHPSGHPLRSDARDGDHLTTTVSYRAALTAPELVAWLTPRLARMGFLEEPPSLNEGDHTLRFQRGGETLDLLLIGRGGVSEVTLVHGH